MSFIVSHSHLVVHVLFVPYHFLIAVTMVQEQAMSWAARVRAGVDAQNRQGAATSAPGKLSQPELGLTCRKDLKPPWR